MSLSCRILKERFPLPGEWRIVRHCRGETPPAEQAAITEEDLTAHLEWARRQAQLMIAEAQAQAAQLVQQAQSEAADIARQASEEGYAQGLAQGLEEGRRQGREEVLAANRTAAARLAQIAQAAEEEQFRLFEDVEPQLVDLALAIARKVVASELATRPELILEILARAIEQARGAGSHLIRLHPDDLDLVQPYMPQAALEAGGGQWSLVADDSLSPGDCLIETDYGVVDARILTQMAELGRLLRGDEADVQQDY
ncbi:MAG: FliH/SctL family protein [Anaerolineae bacterium]|jgi:flagellar assembly protein FliH